MKNGNSLSDDFLNLGTDKKKETEPQTEAPKEEGAKYNDNFNLRLPKGERNRIKKWCVLHDVSMNEFFYMATDYVMTQIERGEVKATKLGIRPVE